MFHMRFCGGRGKKRTLQRPCRISPNLRKISYDILRAQCPIAYAGVGVGQGEYVSALDWTWSKLPGPERAQVSCALQISNPQRIPRLGWTLRAWCSLGGREEGPMDRPTSPPSRGTRQAAVRYCFCRTGPSCSPIRSVLGSTES